MLNSYFLHGSKSEQGLIQDLVNEQLKMFGQEVIYMPRQYITEKKIIKELIVSKFETGYPIEAYLANPDGFGGQGDILSKFGVRSTDEITLIISKERYELSILPFLKNLDGRKSASRPQEGDLIYFPLDNSIFEIKYVEGKRPFYQLNNLYVYELKCELFEYEDEIIDTGLDAVDENVKDFGYMMTLQMVQSNAVPASVNVELSSNQISTSFGKSVSYIDIINPGFGYKKIPKIKVDNAPPGGVTATAVAILTARNNTNYIDKILIINPGIGYTTTPKVIVDSSSGNGFIGTCVLGTGTLGPINIVNGGSNYSKPPAISISTSPAGTSASAVASITSSGIVTAINYINAGSGYTTSPVINIQSSLGISTGSYVFNEIVRGVSTGTSAYVKDWDVNTRKLKVAIINGNFALGESIVGAAASYKLYSVETYDLYNSFASNKEIEDEADGILDFSESNPFGDF